MYSIKCEIWRSDLWGFQDRDQDQLHSGHCLNIYLPKLLLILWLIVVFYFAGAVQIDDVVLDIHFTVSYLRIEVVIWYLISSWI